MAQSTLSPLQGGGRVHRCRCLNQHSNLFPGFTDTIAAEKDISEHVKDDIGHVYTEDFKYIRPLKIVWNLLYFFCTLLLLSAGVVSRLPSRIRSRNNSQLLRIVTAFLVRLFFSEYVAVFAYDWERLTRRGHLVALRVSAMPSIYFCDDILYLNHLI